MNIRFLVCNDVTKQHVGGQYNTFYSCTKRHELRFALRFSSFFCVTTFNTWKFMHAYFSFIIPGLPLFPQSTQYLFDFQFSGMM